METNAVPKKRTKAQLVHYANILEDQLVVAQSAIARLDRELADALNEVTNLERLLEDARNASANLESSLGFQAKERAKSEWELLQGLHLWRANHSAGQPLCVGDNLGTSLGVCVYQDVDGRLIGVSLSDGPRLIAATGFFPGEVLMEEAYNCGQ